MKILHYSLGFPPFRTGGMTKYCMDLMYAEIASGHNVSLLWPGKYKDSSPNCKFKRHRMNSGISSIELSNAHPIPLLDGILTPKLFYCEKDKSVFKDFFISERFDVLHIHTLMGLPKELIEAANEAGVRTVFTSHDYFGICPKCGLMQGNKICLDDHCCADCAVCCKTGMSVKKMQLAQSKLYKTVKNLSVMKWLRKRHIHNVNESYIDNSIKTNAETVPLDTSLQYARLRAYYMSMLSLVYAVHFNSSQTKMVYEKYADFTNSARVISISNSSVKDNRHLKKTTEKIRIAYLGPLSVRKGYFFLYDVLKDIYESGNKNFELHIYQQLTEYEPFVVVHQPFNSQTLSEVMDNTDLLIVPSIWYETFGFTVLEALSYGVPVLVSCNVGAKDLIVPGKNGDICKLSKEDFKEKIIYYLEHPQILGIMNKYIVEEQSIKTMEDHAAEILELYNEGRERNG